MRALTPCSICGTQTSAGDEFCHVCGAEIPEQVAVIAAHPAETAEATSLGPGPFGVGPLRLNAGDPLIHAAESAAASVVPAVPEPFLRPAYQLLPLSEAVELTPESLPAALQWKDSTRPPIGRGFPTSLPKTSSVQSSTLVDAAAPGARPRPSSTDPEIAKKGAQVVVVVGVAVVAALVLVGGLVAGIAIKSSAQGGPGSPSGAATDSAAGAAPSPSVAAGGGTSASQGKALEASSALSSTELKALLLPTGSVGSGVAVVSGAPTGYTLQQYRAGYMSSVTPAECANAKGLMLFTDVDRPGATGWSKTTIYRSNDLRIDGSALRGSQQIRQYATEEEAQVFIKRQRAWFASCPNADYDFPGGKTLFSGSVFADTGDTLLTSASDDSAGTLSAEFDGWVRVGKVVYGAYLLGQTGTSVDQLQHAGSAVIAAAQQRLQQNG